jgi:choline dehydrogenase-like flavoprotein
MSERPKAIVVGTGFGGAVSAHRLVRAGFDVVVLERGRRYQGNDFPSLPENDEMFPDLARWAWSPTRVGKDGKLAPRKHGLPSHWSLSQGLWDIRDMGGTVIVHAAGYGGGSLIYANVHLRAPESVFASGWPTEIDRKKLDPYYDRVATWLDIRPVPSSPGSERVPKADQLVDAAKLLGRKTFRPPIAVRFGHDGKNAAGREQKACIYCGECDTGCRVGAKNTLDLNYLVAVDELADVRTLAEVITVTPDGAGGYAVRYLDHATKSERTETAKYVFLCAGSACTTEILLRSQEALGLLRAKDEKDPLGTHFYGNSDSLGVVFDSKPELKPSRGPVITTALVHEDGDDWLMVQDGGFPAAMTRAVASIRARALMGRNVYPSKTPRPVIDPLSLPLPPDHDAPFRSAPDAAYYILKNGDLAKPTSNMVPADLRVALQQLLTQVQALGYTQVAPVVAPVTLKMREKVVDEVLGWFHLRWWTWLRNKMIACGPALQRWLGVTDEVLAGYAQQVLIERLAPTVENGVRVGSWLLDWEIDPVKPEHRGVLLSMGRDRSPGRYEMKDDGEMSIALRLDPRCQTYGKQELLMRDLAAQWEAELRVNPMWAAARRPITVHQQGGCPMADDAKEGVVDGWGRVHGHRGLFVMDGSVLPRAVGVNPSSTIAALAERNVQHFIETCGEPGVRFVLDEGELERIEAWKKESAGWAIEPRGASNTPFQAEPIGIQFTEIMTGFHAPAAGPRVPTNTLRETLKGKRNGGPHLPDTDVTVNAAPYEDAYRRGVSSGNVLSLTMHASMPDVVGFEADYRHRMEMTGEVAFKWPEQGIDVVAPIQPGGYADLFVPLHFPDYRGRDRFMLYDLSFELKKGDLWHVLGFKHMHVGEGTQAWADTTNLFVTVWPHDRRLVTEGVARLPMETLLYETMGKMKVTGTTDPMKRVWAFATFGNVFFGHLQELYVPALQRYAQLLGVPLPGRSS